MFFSKSKDRRILSPVSGEAIPLSRVPDEVFSSGMLGQGVALDPTDGTVVSPVRGRVLSVAETKHAYTVLSEDGLDLLIHIGIDTVELAGEGFSPLVQVGDAVEVGTVLARVDLEILRKRGFSVITPVLVTNPERLNNATPLYGTARAGEDAVLQYRISS